VALNAAGRVHVVVLAAGRGSRLGELGGEKPKWLIEVAGRTLADRHLDGIAGAGTAVASTTVVVGHAAEAIERDLASRAADVQVLFNPEFAELNNWWSLLRALRELPSDGPVAVINADLLIAAEQVAEFIRTAAANPSEALIAVDRERLLTDESMKVSQTPAGHLSGIGKRDIDGAAGEYIGMLAARGRALEQLRAVLESFVGRPDSADEWYERAVGITAADGVAWLIWPVPSGDWVEIDDDADLRQAEELCAR
jgi:choline kinase